MTRLGDGKWTEEKANRHKDEMINILKNKGQKDILKINTHMKKDDFCRKVVNGFDIFKRSENVKKYNRLILKNR